MSADCRESIAAINAGLERGELSPDAIAAVVRSIQDGSVLRTTVKESLAWNRLLNFESGSRNERVVGLVLETFGDLVPDDVGRHPAVVQYIIRYGPQAAVDIAMSMVLQYVQDDVHSDRADVLDLCVRDILRAKQTQSSLDVLAEWTRLTPSKQKIVDTFVASLNETNHLHLCDTACEIARVDPATFEGLFTAVIQKSVNSMLDDGGIEEVVAHKIIAKVSEVPNSHEPLFALAAKRVAEGMDSDTSAVRLSALDTIVNAPR